MIEEVGDLVDCLDEEAASANKKLAENGVSERIAVSLDGGRMFVKVDEKEEFSTPVDDKTARSSYNPASSAIKRAMKNLISAARLSEVAPVEQTDDSSSGGALGRAFDEAFGKPFDRTFEKRGFKKPRGEGYTGGKTFREEMMWTINHINERAGQDGVKMLFTSEIGNGHCVVKGDGEVIIDVLADFDVDSVMTNEVFFGPLRAIKKRIWRLFDDINPMKKHDARHVRREYATAPRINERKDGDKTNEAKKPVEPPKRPFNERLSEIVCKANEELSKINVEQLVVSSDSVGVYVCSGRIPVVSEPVGIKDDDSMVKSMNDKIWDFVHSARGAFERRQNDSERIGVLEYDTACDKAMYEKYNAKPAEVQSEGGAEEKSEGASDDSGDWKYFHDPDVAASIVRAVKRAIKPFNRTAGVRFYGLSTKIGEDAITMSIRGFSRGVVVMIGGEPCYITSFPLVGNNKTAEETIAYMEGAIKDLCEKRMAHLEAIKSEFERFDRLHELSNRREALRKESETLDNALKAMAM